MTGPLDPDGRTCARLRVEHTLAGSLLSIMHLILLLLVCGIRRVESPWFLVREAERQVGVLLPVPDVIRHVNIEAVGSNANAKGKLNTADSGDDGLAAISLHLLLHPTVGCPYSGVLEDGCFLLVRGGLRTILRATRRL